MNEAKLIWITGLSGSGKTTIATKVYEKIKEKNYVLLDGDTLREVFGNDLGHSLSDRLKTAKRISAMCRFFVKQNINVICATMSLFKEIQDNNRKNNENYIEVFIDCDMEELMKRDQKNLYTQAIEGKIIDVVGIDLPYDKPVNCELIIDNSKQEKLEEKVQKILNLIGKDR